MNKPTLAEFLARLKAGCDNPTPFQFIGSPDVEALIKMVECMIAHQNAMIKGANGRQDAREWIVRGLNKLTAFIPLEKTPSTPPNAS